MALLLEGRKARGPRLCAAAADRLGSLGPDAKDAIPARLGRLDDERLGAAAAANRGGALLPLVPHVLARIGKDAIPGLVEILKDQKKKPSARYHAALALAEMGAKARAARPALEAALGDQYLAVALESARAYLRAGGDPAKTLPVVRAGLRHEAAFILEIAAQIAEQMGGRGEGLVKDLTPLLDHRSGFGSVRRRGDIGRPPNPPCAARQAPEIGAAAGSGSRWRRRLSGWSQDAKDTVPAWSSAKGKNREVRPRPGIKNMAVIGGGGGHATLWAPQKPGRLTKEDVMSAGGGGPDAKAAVPELICLDDRACTAGGGASWAGSVAGGEGRSAALTKMLGDEEKRRVWAVPARSRAKPRRSHGPLGSVEDDDPDELLGFVHTTWQTLVLGPDARPARDALLVAATNLKTPAGTRLHTARALGNLRDDAEMIVPKMIELLGRPAKGLNRVSDCEAAAATLEGLGPKAKAAVPALRKVLDDDDRERGGGRGLAGAGEDRQGMSLIWW